MDKCFPAAARKRVALKEFYLDEDSWQIVLVDVYGRRDQLWRWQEAHTAMAYDKRVPRAGRRDDLRPAVEPLPAQAFNNEEPENVEKEFSDEYFSPANVSKQVIK